MSVKSVIAKIRGIKHFEILVAVVAVVVMLIIYVSTLLPGKSGTDAGAAVSGSDYCTEMERALTETVSALKGAGKTKAVIRWESGVEAVIGFLYLSGDYQRISELLTEQDEN